MVGGAPIPPAYGYHDEPVFAPRPVRQPEYVPPPPPTPRRRQPEQVSTPKPRPQPRPDPGPEPVQRVSLPGPDDLGIRLTEWVDLPPPEALGIGVR
jgi:hypothetical protein